jgi:hypothetical protein
MRIFPRMLDITIGAPDASGMYIIRVRVKRWARLYFRLERAVLWAAGRFIP